MNLRRRRRGRCGRGSSRSAPAPRDRARLVARLARRARIGPLGAGGALRASPFDLFIEIRDGLRLFPRAPRPPRPAVAGACEVRALAAALCPAAAQRFIATLPALAEVRQPAVQPAPKLLQAPRTIRLLRAIGNVFHGLSSP